MPTFRWTGARAKSNSSTKPPIRGNADMTIRFWLSGVLLATAGFAQQTTPPPKQPPRTPPAAPANPAGTMDSLSNSLQDLNAIRDGNLTRVQKEGCSPETAARLTELR